MAHVGDRREMHTGFWWGNLRKRNDLEAARCRWKPYVTVSSQEILWYFVYWIDLT
jgi:hypothetical protein